MHDAATKGPEMRVLMLAATPKDLVLTCDILIRAGIDCIGCDSLEELTEKLHEDAGAILLPEESITGAGDPALVRYLAEQPSWSDLPMLVMARPGADSAGVATAMDKYGNVTVLERPMRIAALVSAVRSALRARQRQYQVREDARALADARDLLEQRVLERTIELHQTNEILEQKVQETKDAEARAQLLLRELVAAQENERARIARDLHDELGQQVTSLRLHLSQIERDLSADSKLSARAGLDTLNDEAERIDRQISFLAWKIRPTTIEEMGLEKALHGYVHEWSRNFDVAAGFSAADFRPDFSDQRLQPEVETNIYRIAQESLNNVAKYADASRVAVLLNISESEISLIVEDDGRGFDTAAASNGNRPAGDGGLGIRGMHERAALLGGTVQIESNPTQGTTVFVRIPARFRPQEAPLLG